MKLPLIDADARILGIFDRLQRARCLQLTCKMAALYGVTPEGLVGRSRHPRVVLARHHLCALVRWSTSLSLPEIGELLDLDHTTVMAAVRRHEARINADVHGAGDGAGGPEDHGDGGRTVADGGAGDGAQAGGGALVALRGGVGAGHVGGDGGVRAAS